MKTTCLNCGHEFNGKILKDAIGSHCVCPECGCSFDVNVLFASYDGYSKLYEMNFDYDTMVAMAVLGANQNTPYEFCYEDLALIALKISEVWHNFDKYIGIFPDLKPNTLESDHYISVYAYEKCLIYAKIYAEEIKLGE